MNMPGNNNEYMSSVEVSVLLPVLSWIFFKDNVNEWVTFACTGRALLMSPKGRNASRDGLV